MLEIWDVQVGRALLMISDLYDYYAELLNAGDRCGDGPATTTWAMVEVRVLLYLK